jgi:hypothetical protein
MLEQKSQHQACKIYTLIHVLLAIMVLAVSCRPPNTEPWVLRGLFFFQPPMGYKKKTN